MANQSARFAVAVWPLSLEWVKHGSGNARRDSGEHFWGAVAFGITAAIPQLQDNHYSESIQRTKGKKIKHTTHSESVSTVY